MGADIAYFQDPLLAKRPLQGQIPLLGIRCDEMSWHGQTEEEL